MNLKNNFIKGTLLLTFAGVLSRFMGFFYRIFLANAIGAEGMGIYQMIFPIYSICFSLCASGIETAISKLVAEKFAKNSPSEALGVLKTGLTITLLLSVGCSLTIYYYAEFLANIFLKEPRCAQLLKFLAFTIPFGTVQSCFCGYYFGIHHAFVPSVAQLTEQSFRVLSVFLLCKIFSASKVPFSPIIAVLGLIAGEFCSFLFTITCFSFSRKDSGHLSFHRFFTHIQEMSKLVVPLTTSRLCINLLVSLEATLIPNALKSHGMNSSTALSIYGILTGMALPFILFPNALTGSISLMLLPKVSESQAGGNFSVLNSTLRKIFSFCFGLGFLCLLFFLCFGKILGELFFSSSLAGNFITTLAWICPFLYLNTTLNSVLNGLGRTDITFFTGIGGPLLRIGFILLGVPKLGIQGYLYGLLFCQLFVTFASFYFLRFSLHKNPL